MQILLATVGESNVGDLKNFGNPGKAWAWPFVAGVAGMFIRGQSEERDTFFYKSMDIHSMS